MPLGSLFRAKRTWDGVMEKVEIRLGGWKKLYLSNGGTVTLIKSNIARIPSYYLSFFKVPISVEISMEKI